MPRRSQWLSNALSSALIVALGITGTACSRSTVPAAPTGVSAAADGASGVRLGWNPVPGASGYEVLRNGAVVGSPTTIAFEDSGLKASTSYAYSVRARTTTSESPASEVVSVSTGPLDAPQTMCRISDPLLTEISGMASSVRFPGIIWVHNDSGDSARVFAVDASTCAIKAQVRLSGIKAYDFEALSMGRDASGNPELWVGDTGDNGRSRTNIRLHRFAEPKSLVDQTVAVDTVTVKWSDGPRDCESLLVEPIANGRVFLISKQFKGGMYQLQGDFRSTGKAITGLRVAETRSYATDAAISPDNSLTVVRFSDSATLLSGVPGSSPRDFSLPAQPQGEAITFTPDSKYAYIASEGAADLVRIAVAGR